MDKVADLSGEQFGAVPFARETYIKGPISVGNNFEAYHLRAKHG